MVRLVTFDALHTLFAPRLPIYVQYAHVFHPHLGPLDPLAIKASFKLALSQLQQERPAYAHGHRGFWSEVIKRTAVGAGGDVHAVESALPEMVPRLLKRFSSKDGYRLFDDALPTLQRLKQLRIRTALVSNADSRIVDVLADLDVTPYLDPVLISETEAIEKPNPAIFLKACQLAGVAPSETLHIGDELLCDYQGARSAGLQALLLRRPGPEGEAAHKESDENLRDVRVVESLNDVIMR